MIACGCGLRAGTMVSLDQIERHRDHTTEALLYWELLMGDMRPDEETKAKIAEARIAVDKFVGDRVASVHPVARAMGLV